MNLIRDQFEHIPEGLHWQRWCRSPEQIGAWHYCCLNSIELMSDDVVTFGPSKPPLLARWSGFSLRRQDAGKLYEAVSYTD